MAHAVTPELFNVRKNQIKMVFDRGYELEEDTADNERNTLKATYGQFRRYMLESLSESSFSDLLSKTYLKRGEGGRPERVLVWYPEVPETARQLGSADASDLILKIREVADESEVPVSDVVIVSKYQESSMMRTTLSQQRMNYDFFTYPEMSYNPAEHAFVAPHRVLPREEAEKFLRQIGDSRVPQISVSDRMCRHIGARIGDVVEIDRSACRAYHADVDRALFRRLVVKQSKT